MGTAGSFASLALLAAWPCSGQSTSASAGAASAAAVTSAPSPTPAPGRAPRIAVEPARFDFGRVLADHTLSKQFSIRNFGSADLVIERVSTTCGCTAALMVSKVVKPGGRASLRVTFDTTSLTGKVARSVLIRSNDPAREVLELTLEATVAPAEKPSARP
jgi:hypothetical protein